MANEAIALMRRLAIAGGTLVTMDPHLGQMQGDLLIEDDRIAAIATSVDVTDCDVIDATDMIVLPGLVDAHRHLWYSAIRGVGMDATLTDMVSTYWPQLAAHYTAEDLYVATRAGAVDALQHGVTTVFDWCHVINGPEHGAAAATALHEIPIRAVYAYGASMDRKLGEFAGELKHADSWEPARRLRADIFPSDTGLRTMALALQGPEFTTLDVTREDVSVARDLGLRMSMHVGIPAGAPARASVEMLHGAGLLGADMQFVHCCTTSEQEFRRIADAGGRTVACPMAELAMGMGEPPIARTMRAGLPVALGCDAVCTASGDLFDEARTALFAERSQRTAQAAAAGAEVTSREQLGISAYDALAAVTINAARACWLDDVTGSLTPGKQADIILLRTTDLNLAPPSDIVGLIVSSAHGGNVDTVLVGGEVVIRSGQMKHLDVRRLREDLVACRARIDAVGGFKPPPSRPQPAAGSVVSHG